MLKRTLGQLITSAVDRQYGGVQTRLAEDLGVSVGFLGKVMKGQTGFSAEICLKFAEITGHNPNEVLEANDMTDHAERIERIFYKGTNPRIDSYSGFFDNAHRQDTGLGSYLRERGVGSIIALGLATDYCVRASCLDARALGFEVAVVLEGCRPVELAPGDGERALAELERAGVRLLSESPPAQGFGGAARACMASKRFTPGLDRDGRLLD